MLGQALKPATSPCGVTEPAPAHKSQCGWDTGDVKVPRSRQTQQQGKDSREGPGPEPSLPHSSEDTPRLGLLLGQGKANQGNSPQVEASSRVRRVLRGTMPAPGPRTGEGWHPYSRPPGLPGPRAGPPRARWWIFWCCRRCCFCTKLFSHSVQLYGRSPVWMRWCRTRSDGWLKLFPQ